MSASQPQQTNLIHPGLMLFQSGMTQEQRTQEQVRHMARLKQQMQPGVSNRAPPIAEQSNTANHLNHLVQNLTLEEESTTTPQKNPLTNSPQHPQPQFNFMYSRMPYQPLYRVVAEHEAIHPPVVVRRSRWDSPGQQQQQQPAGPTMIQPKQQYQQQQQQPGPVDPATWNVQRV